MRRHTCQSGESEWRKGKRKILAIMVIFIRDKTWWWRTARWLYWLLADYEKRANNIESCRRSLFVYSEDTGVRPDHEPRQQLENVVSPWNIRAYYDTVSVTIMYSRLLSKLNRKDKNWERLRRNARKMTQRIHLDDVDCERRSLVNVKSTY